MLLMPSDCFVLPFLQLFYRFTTGLLFLSCALIGIPELTGKNIQCHSHTKISDHFMKMVEQYCWVTGTHVNIHHDEEGPIKQVHKQC